MKKNIIVVAEIFNSTIRPITYELIGCAEKIAETESADIKIIIINHKPDAYARELSEKTQHDIIAVATPALKQYNSHAYKNILKKISDKLNPLYLCIGHTSQGIDFAPTLAVKLGCACLTAINGLTCQEGEFNFSRSLYGGKIDAFIKSKTTTTILTIQPGSFKKSENTDMPGQIILKTDEETAKKIESNGISQPETVKSDLNDAHTIISIGRGIEDPENIEAAESFASCFINAAIACSRPVVDMGWMKYKHQVGVTGAVVSPEIYIACGISGSSQHIAGMKNSDFVIAINSDPNAAIFNFSDICIIEDIFIFFESFQKFTSHEK